MKRVRLSYPYVFVWMPIFIIAPMLFVLYYAFFRDGHFTLEFAKQVFADTTYLGAFWNSLWIAVVTTLACLLIGYPVSYILSKMNKHVAAFVSLLFILPMWMNMLLRTLAWKIILSDGGVIMTAIPGKHHLFGLKQALYDAPYYNDEKEPDADGLEVVERVRVRSEITLGSQQDINALFQMILEGCYAG